MKILMICLGNICRSPMAHGILEDMAEKNGLHWEVDSCGTGGYHNGKGPNPNSIRVAASHGLDISHQISRELTMDDLENFDLLVAMDSSNYSDVKALCTEEQSKKLRLLLNYAWPGENRTIPDPWYDHSLYEPVYDMIYEACEAMVRELT